MSRKELQKNIVQNHGYIFSDGTLNLLHLLTKAGDLIDGYNLKAKITKYWTPRYRDFLKQFQPTEYANEYEPDIMHQLAKRKKSLYMAQYYGLIELIPDGQVEYGHYHLWDDFESYMNNIAPSGYYFGSSDGDGACIGWFRYEGDEQ